MKIKKNRILKGFMISFLLITITLNVRVKADTFLNEVNKTNEYLYTSDYRNDYKRYLKDGENETINFGYNRGKIEASPLFKMGGFLSEDEYKITLRDNNTYLYDGIKYWSLTEKNSKYFVVGETEEKSQEEIYRNKTTEYILSDVKITGEGTIKDPWIFEPLYKVTINAENGTVEYYKINDDNKTSSDGYINRDGTLIVKVTPDEGYKYITSDCGIYLEGYNESTNEATISRVNRDLTCNIIFGLGLYKIQVGKEGETAEPKFIYSRYNEGIYVDEIGQTIIKNLTKLPLKEGYTFKGYNYIDKGGNKIKVIDQTGVIDKGKAISIVSDTTLEGIWEANKYTVTLNANGGSVSQDKMTVVYGSKYGTLPNALKLGSGFVGWYTAATGGEKVDSETIVKTARDHVLYAHYETCAAGKYTNSTTTKCVSCASGYTVAAGQGTAANTCKMTVPAGKKVTTPGGAAENCDPNTYSTGTTINQTQTSGCTPCQEGYERPAGASKCTIITIVETDVSCEVTTSENKRITYTGKCKYVDDGDGNWRLKLLTSGTLTLGSSINVDIFAVGGGGGGGNGTRVSDNGASNGGGGGGGGYTKTVKNSFIKGSYTVTIGEGGTAETAGGTTSFVSSTNVTLISADGGKGASWGGGGGSGGSGGGKGVMTGTAGAGASDGGSSGGTGQGTTTREFAEKTGDLYSGGGGGAGGQSADVTHNYPFGYAGAGGAGGGASGTYGFGGGNGYGAGANTGGGGGGGAGVYGSPLVARGAGGKGGSGIIVIRNKR